MKKKNAIVTFIVFTSIMVFSNYFIAFAGISAKHSLSKVLINGVENSFEAYTINGSNYFKPEDLAKALSGSNKNFDVFFDKSQGIIQILKNKQYSGVDYEIKYGDGTLKNAEQISYKLFVDTEEVQLLAYSIDSNPYYKLQDIMQISDINVTWNGKKKIIVIDTNMAYADTPKPLSGFLICVDPGHGISNSNKKEQIAPNSSVVKPAFVSGTSGAVYSEAEVNLSVGIILKEKLLAQGANVIMTREGPEATLSNIGRAEFGNTANADLAIRLHCDGNSSSKPMGISMLVPGKQYVNEGLANTSYKIGETVLNKVIEKTGAKNKGVVIRDDLTGFNWSTIPSILIEMGFMTNPQEDELLGTKEYQEKIADGITDAIVEMYKTEINTVAAIEPPLAEPTEAEILLNSRIKAYMEQNTSFSLEEATWRVKADLDKPEFLEANVLTEEQLQSSSVIVNKRNQVPNDYVPSDLVKITDRVSLRSEAKLEFDRMVSDAKIEGYYIAPISGFRTVEYQRNLYNRYLKSDSFANVETYSARAGFSEHHTGLAIDVGGANKNMSSFVSSREYPWVVENGNKYGFIIRYLPNETGITGYMSEPWHLRYVGIDIATKMKTEGIRTLEEYIGKYQLY